MVTLSARLELGRERDSGRAAVLFPPDGEREGLAGDQEGGRAPNAANTGGASAPLPPAMDIETSAETPSLDAFPTPPSLGRGDGWDGMAHRDRLGASWGGQLPARPSPEHGPNTATHSCAPALSARVLRRRACSRLTTWRTRVADSRTALFANEHEMHARIEELRLVGSIVLVCAYLEPPDSAAAAADTRGAIRAAYAINSANVIGTGAQV